MVGQAQYSQKSDWIFQGQWNQKEAYFMQKKWRFCTTQCRPFGDDHSRGTKVRSRGSKAEKGPAWWAEFGSILVRQCEIIYSDYQKDLELSVYFILEDL